MESKLQKILEVLRLTPSKDKSFERESDSSPSTEKRENKIFRCKNVKETSIMSDVANKDGNVEKRHVRKYGVPCQFYPRSQSLESQPVEKSLNVDSTNRMAVRRNSSLDSETERFCMRYEGADKLSKEYGDLWRLSGRENSMTRSNEEFNEMLNENRVVNIVNCRSQESVSAKSCYEARKDSYEDYFEYEAKDSMPTNFLNPQISSKTCSAVRNLDCNMNHLRSAGEDQGQKAQMNDNRGFEEVTEDNIQEDISGYERWIDKSKFDRQDDARVGNVEQYSPISDGFENKEQALRESGIVSTCGNIADDLSTDQLAKPIEAYDSHSMRESSTRRHAYRLRRQDGIDAVNDTAVTCRGFQTSPIGDSRRRMKENTVPLLGNKPKSQEFWQDQIGRCEIRILDPFPETNDRNETPAYFQYEGDTGVHVGEFTTANYEEPKFIDDPFSAYAMEKDFRFMHGNASRRSMKLRRDSPFAFPLIEEFARKTNSMSGAYYKQPVKSSLQGNKFSGNIGCYLESQQFGEEVTMGNSLTRISKGKRHMATS